MKDDKKIEIRDSRETGWFWIDRDFVDNYAKLLSPGAILTYLSICRHADAKQTCFQEIRTIANELSLGKSTVMRGIKELEALNIISVTKRRKRNGARGSNLYILLSKSAWKILVPPQVLGSNDKVSPQVLGHDKVSPQVHKKHITSNVIINNELENNNIRPPSEVSEDGLVKKIDIFEDEETKLRADQKSDVMEIERVVGMFRGVSKNWESFYKGYQRIAIKSLIKLAKADGEDVAKIIEKAKSLRDVPLTPQAFTPQDILNKYDKLLAYKPQKPLVNSAPPGGAPYTPGRFTDKKGIIIKH
jgi:hypothetical protein